MANPLMDDATVDFLLHDVLDVTSLTRLPHFSMHSGETLRMSVDASRRFAREVLAPTYRVMDQEAPRHLDGRILTHPLLASLYPRVAELGALNATRPLAVGGQQLPATVALVMGAYLHGGSPAGVGFASLTSGAAHLLETFGSAELQRLYMQPMYEGRWTGTMALTEPQAGSSLADVRTRATPTENGHHLISGQKVFISGGDNSFAENIVHLVLARVDGAPAGIKGISLFCVPRLRVVDGKLVPNDVKTSGTFHKLGWRGIPSVALQLGEGGDCHGYLVGPLHQGLKCMFQMMNEARLSIGACAVSTASVGYQAALEYAKTRPQGRALTNRDATSPPINIVEHADVRRMLLAQKAMVEGGLSLLLQCSLYTDRMEASPDVEERTRCSRLLDLLTPVAKTFPSEKGFESNAQAVQVHGGYGYTSEYLPEALLRDQKLNSIHEGTTGIQSLDLLGRKVLLDGGAGMALLQEEISAEITRARTFPALRAHADQLEAATTRWGEALVHLGGMAAGGDLEGAMIHSVAHLELAGIVCVAWQWLRMAAFAAEGLAGGGTRSKAFYEGKLAACAYWFSHELPRVHTLAALLQSNERSFADVPVDGL